MHFDKVLPYRKSERSQFDADDELNFKRYTAAYFETGAPFKWKGILQKHLLYKKPHLIHAADTRDDFYKNLFMMAAFFRVGRHEFIVRSPEKIYDRDCCEYVDTRREGEPPDY